MKNATISRSSLPAHEITLGLLCGGQGRRLGAAKQFLRHHSGPDLLNFQLKRLEGHFETTMLLVGESPIDGVGPTIQQVEDPHEYRREGPLAGLAAALGVCPTEWLALLPIDNPYFPPQALAAALSESKADDSMVGFLDHTQRPQWLPGLYHRSLATPARDALVAGVRSLGQFAKSQSHRFLAWTESSVSAQSAFSNLNTIEQARAAGFRLPDGILRGQEILSGTSDRQAQPELRQD